MAISMGIFYANIDWNFDGTFYVNFDENFDGNLLEYL